MYSDAEHTAEKLVALYHDVLSTILDRSDSFLDTLTRRVMAILPCHGFVMIVLPDQQDEVAAGRPANVAHVRLSLQTHGNAPQVQMAPIGVEPGQSLIDELKAGAERDIATMMEIRRPGHSDLYIHWLGTGKNAETGADAGATGTAGAAGAIFRVKSPEENYDDFSEEERKLIAEVEPHIFNCIRVYQELTRAQRATFDFFADRCGALAASSGLTSTEERVLRKMVEGASNKSISEELGTSLATVKTHISHILQKTGCRNRTDLIGTHFSSKHAAVGRV